MRPLWTPRIIAVLKSLLRLGPHTSAGRPLPQNEEILEDIVETKGPASVTVPQKQSLTSISKNCLERDAAKSLPVHFKICFCTHEAGAAQAPRISEAHNHRYASAGCQRQMVRTSYYEQASYVNHALIRRCHEQCRPVINEFTSQSFATLQMLR